MNILFIIKVNILVPIKWSYRLPPSTNMSTIESRMVSLFWACSLISFEVTLFFFWCWFLDPHLTTYHSNTCVQIIGLFDLGTSTLDEMPELLLQVDAPVGKKISFLRPASSSSSWGEMLWKNNQWPLNSSERVQTYFQIMLQLLTSLWERTTLAALTRCTVGVATLWWNYLSVQNYQAPRCRGR